MKSTREFSKTHPIGKLIALESGLHPEELGYAGTWQLRYPGEEGTPDGMPEDGKHDCVCDFYERVK